MNFTKMQGAGNDFIVVEAGSETWDWSKAAIAMCDRHFGIGADGLLLVMPSEITDFRMRIFNPDGSEAEACGNGLRCVARYVLDKGLAKPEAQEILIETLSGVRKAKLLKAGGKITGIQVSMGSPKFRAEDIPVTIEEGSILDITPILSYPVSVDDWQLRLDFVSIGNPHAVYFWQQPVANFPLAQIGPEVERHKMFPRRTNFEVARVISRAEIEARVWERGVGETLACGSGVCAITVAAQLHGYVDNRVKVNLPGGTLDVEWAEGREVFLGGPAEVVFTGKWRKAR